MIYNACIVQFRSKIPCLSLDLLKYMGFILKDLYMPIVGVGSSPRVPSSGSCKRGSS